MTFGRSRWCVGAVALATTLVCSTPVEAQLASEVFIGYSYLQADPGGATFNGEPIELETEAMHGGEVSATFFTSRQLGWDVAFVGQNGSITPPSFLEVPDGVDATVDFRQVAFMAGPRVRLLRTERASVDVRALIGGANGNAKAVAGLFALDAHNTVLAASIGASFNVNLGETFAFRVAQPELYITRFGGATQSSLRFSTGIVIVYGR